MTLPERREALAYEQHELRKLAARWEEAAESAARRAIYGTSSGGATGTGGAEHIVAMFAVADILRARSQTPSGGGE